MNIVEQSPRRSQGDYSAIFTEPEENNNIDFSIIAHFRQLSEQLHNYSFILLVSSLRNRAVVILKTSASVL